MDARGRLPAWAGAKPTVPASIDGIVMLLSWRRMGALIRLGLMIFVVVAVAVQRARPARLA